MISFQAFKWSIDSLHLHNLKLQNFNLKLNLFSKGLYWWCWRVATTIFIWEYTKRKSCCYWKLRMEKYFQGEKNWPIWMHIAKIGFYIMIYRSSRPDVFCKKGVQRIFSKFTGKHLCQSLYFNNDAGLRLLATHKS